jgi:glycerate 2-kinase
MSFDYVVVGGGTAGCMVAAWLAEREQGTVALLEAGPEDKLPEIAIPAALGFLSRPIWIGTPTPILSRSSTGAARICPRPDARRLELSAHHCSGWRDAAHRVRRELVEDARMAPARADDRPVLVAPDSFKGTFRAAQVAAAIGRGLASVGLVADLCPIADGGEGTLDASVRRRHRRRVTVSDPLGRPVEAEYCLNGTTAVVETAAASGLTLITAKDRDAIAASTAGTGQLIAHAIASGARTIYVGVGGSATTDGGAGAIATIEAAGGTRGAQLVVLCDVQTPFEHAARVFGRQKGATPAQVDWLTSRLEEQARRLTKDPTGVAMTGAAGGLAGGLWAAFDARLVRGAARVLDHLRFEARCRGARAVISGEGRLDHQSLEGKAVWEVAHRARGCDVPCHAIVGSQALSPEATRAVGLMSVRQAGTLAALERAAEELGRSLRCGD